MARFGFELPPIVPRLSSGPPLPRPTLPKVWLPSVPPPLLRNRLHLPIILGDFHLRLHGGSAVDAFVKAAQNIPSLVAIGVVAVLLASDECVHVGAIHGLGDVIDGVHCAGIGDAGMGIQISDGDVANCWSFYRFRLSCSARSFPHVPTVWPASRHQSSTCGGFILSLLDSIN